MNGKLLTTGFACVSLVFAAGIAAHADTIDLQGSVWKVPIAGPAPSADDAELPTPTTPPGVTFSIAVSSDLTFAETSGPGTYVVDNSSPTEEEWSSRTMMASVPNC